MQRWRAAGVLAAAVVTGALTAGLAGCGGTSLAGGPAPSAGPSEQVPDSAPAWPDPALTVVTTPHGVDPPPEEITRERYPDAFTIAEQDGSPVADVVRDGLHAELFSAFAQDAKGPLGARYSAVAWGDPDDPSGLPWVAFTGAEPPAGLVSRAEELPFPLELRGGALLSEADADAARDAGTDAFAAVTPEGTGWSGGLDAPTAVFSFGGFPPGLLVSDDDARAAVIAAAQRALGRAAPFAVELSPDDRDPQTTQPATWFLPAGFVSDPAATSVEVLVAEQGCTSGDGAAGNTAEPVVEVTATQVRIAVSTSIRLGPQTCPGHPLAPVVIDLGQPLGDRQLVDVNGTVDDAFAPRGGDLVVPPAA